MQHGGRRQNPLTLRLNIAQAPLESRARFGLFTGGSTIGAMHVQPTSPDGNDEQALSVKLLCQRLGLAP